MVQIIGCQGDQDIRCSQVQEIQSRISNVMAEAKETRFVIPEVAEPAL